MSFPDIFTVLAEMPRCGRGQNMTSSSKPEQTQQSGSIFTSGVIGYGLEDELALPVVSHNNRTACLSRELIHCLNQREREGEVERERRYRS